MSTEYKDKISVWMQDKGYDIPAHLTDDDGNDFDLTGYTVVVRGSEPDAANSKFENACTKTVEAEGKVKWTVGASDFDTFGKTYVMVFIATKTGVEVSFGGLTIEVGWKPQPTS